MGDAAAVGAASRVASTSALLSSAASSACDSVFAAAAAAGACQAWGLPQTRRRPPGQPAAVRGSARTAAAAGVAGALAEEFRTAMPLAPFPSAAGAFARLGAEADLDMLAASVWQSWSTGKE